MKIMILLFILGGWGWEKIKSYVSQASFKVTTQPKILMKFCLHCQELKLQDYTDTHGLSGTGD